MSWDVFISKEEVKNLEDGNLTPISDVKTFVKNLNEIVPNIEYSEEQYGIYRDKNCSITFSVGDEDSDSVTHLMLYIRGEGDVPMSIIQSICNQFDCYAMDCSTGDQMNFDEVDKASFEAWRTYRDKIIRKK